MNIFSRFFQWLINLFHQSNPPLPIHMPKVFFGHMISDLVPLNEITISIGTLRTWDTKAMWYWIAQGNWDGFEYQLSLAEKLGAEVLYVFGHHSTQPLSAISPDICIPNTMVPTIDAWTAFITKIVMRAAGWAKRIHAYEMWNEPSITPDTWAGGTVAQMVDRALIGYNIIKKLQPEAIVLTPSFCELSSYGNIKWMDEYLSLGGAKYADAIAFHSYGDVIADINVLKTIMAKYNVNLPIWNTETIGVDLLEQQARLGIQRVVLDSQILGNEDWNINTLLGTKWQNVYNKLKNV